MTDRRIEQNDFFNMIYEGMYVSICLSLNTIKSETLQSEIIQYS